MKRLFSLLVFAVIVIVAGFSIITNTVKAQTPTPPPPTPTPVPSQTSTPVPTPIVVIPDSLNSWAWSSNIGWVDFRNIKINKSNGLLSGYGWSSNIGWIKFDGLSDYPDNGAQKGPAKIDLNNGKVSGWVRACAGTIGGEVGRYGADCSSMVSRNDGWDGWIELSDKNNSPSRVKMDIATGRLTGMAWGSSVIGWLQFGALFSTGQLSAVCTGSSDQNGNVTFIASANGGSNLYQYNWNNSGWQNNSRYISPYNQSQQSLSATLQVKDTASQEIINPLCPTINRQNPNPTPTPVPNPTGAAEVISLTIGPRGDTASLASYRVRQGSFFGLKWNNTLPKFNPNYIDATRNPDGYVCDKVIPSGQNTNWTSSWNQNVNFGGNVSGMSTDDTGRFTFSIRCTSATKPAKTASVSLHVILPYEDEL